MNLLSLKVDVFDLLQEGEMGKGKDLSKFVKKFVRCWWLDNWVVCSSSGLFLVCSGWYLSKVVWGRNTR